MERSMQLQLRRYPDPELLKVATPVTVFDEGLAAHVEEMFTLMYEERGVGLGDARDGVGDGHERRVEGGHHAPHHLVADDAREGEGGEH